jgi:hypothetical protein
MIDWLPFVVLALVALGASALAIRVARSRD